MIKNRDLLIPGYFPVQEKKLSLRDEFGNIYPSPNGDEFKAIVKEEDLSILGVVSKNYGLLRNQDVFEMVFNSINEMGLDANVIDFDLTETGSRMKAVIEFPEIICDPGDGHNIAYRLYIGNGYDGSYNFSFIHGAIRYICGNGMVFGVKVDEFKSKHSKNVEVNFDNVFKRFEKILPHASEIIAKRTQKIINSRNPYPTIDLMDVITFLSNLPNKYREEAGQKIDSSKAEYWDIYNAFTNVITHDNRKRSGFRRDNLLGGVHSSFEKVVGMSGNLFEDTLRLAKAA